MQDAIQIGDVVVAQGHHGRFEVLEFIGCMAKIRLIAEDEDGPVDLGYVETVPISTLAPLKRE
jgi:hypothetical protein